jgi:hypothetical protein
MLFGRVRTNVFQPTSTLNHKYGKDRLCEATLIVPQVLGIDLSPIQPTLYCFLLDSKHFANISQRPPQLFF